MYRKFLLRWGFQKLVVGGALEFDSREPKTRRASISPTIDLCWDALDLQTRYVI